MVWVRKIFNHPEYQEYLKRIEGHETDRIYCHHDLVHFLDVARIAYILNFERGYELEKDMIYLVGLLHDIGRWQQYETGIPHHQASAILAKDLLWKVGYDEQKTEEVLDAILSHSSKSKIPAGEEGGLSHLAEVIRDADKISRGCYGCKAKDSCNWSEEKKNLEILW